MAIKIEEPDEKDSFIVKGRGEFQMAILIETMRREDFELCVGRPEVIFKRDENGQLLEPIEQLYVDCDENFMGVVTDKIAQRKGRMVNCVNNGTGRVRLEFSVPSRGSSATATSSSPTPRARHHELPARGLRAPSRRFPEPFHGLHRVRPRPGMPSPTPSSTLSRAASFSWCRAIPSTKA